MAHAPTKPPSKTTATGQQAIWDIPPLRSAPGPGRAYAIGAAKQQAQSGLPPKEARNYEQTCGKCGAQFRWERSGEADLSGQPLKARLIKASDKCDCGYGKGRAAADKK